MKRNSLLLHENLQYYFLNSLNIYAVNKSGWYIWECSLHIISNNIYRALKLIDGSIYVIGSLSRLDLQITKNFTRL